MNSNLFPSVYIVPESNLKDNLLQLWERVQDSLQRAWIYSKNLYGITIQFISSFYQKHQTVSYMIAGIATFCTIKCIGKWYLNSLSKQKGKKQKNSDDELQSTLQSKSQKYSNSCQQSILSIKLPLHQILQSENQDDQDRIFFQVINNYRHT